MSDDEGVPMSLWPDEYPATITETKTITVREHTRRIRRNGQVAPQGVGQWITWGNEHHPTLTIGQAKVMWLLEHAERACTDEELCELAKAYRLQLSDSGIRSRRHELVNLGLVEADGESLTAAHRHATCWKLVT